MRILIISLFFITLFSSDTYAIWPFTRESDGLSYYAPCWGENNKIYFIKKVTYGTYIAFTPFALLQMGRYSVDKIEYYLCSMNYDGTNKKEIKEITKERDLERLKEKYQKEFGKEWHGGSKLDAYMSYCQATNRLVYNLEWGMWSINTDGSDEKLLDYQGSHPSWSPDGKKIVYEKYPEGLWLMDADGSNKSKLSPEENKRITIFDKKTYEIYEDKSPIWSPKGDLIAFVCKGWIWVMKPDGTERRKVSETSHLSDWSPDGTKIMTSALLGIVDLNGNVIKRFEVVEDYVHGRWSPNGKMFIGENLSVFDITGKKIPRKEPFPIKEIGKHWQYKRPNNIW